MQECDEEGGLTDKRLAASLIAKLGFQVEAHKHRRARSARVIPGGWERFASVACIVEGITSEEAEERMAASNPLMAALRNLGAGLSVTRGSSVPGELETAPFRESALDSSRLRCSACGRVGRASSAAAADAGAAALPSLCACSACGRALYYQPNVPARALEGAQGSVQGRRR